MHHNSTNFPVPPYLTFTLTACIPPPKRKIRTKKISSKVTGISLQGKKTIASGFGAGEVAQRVKASASASLTAWVQILGTQLKARSWGKCL